MKRFETGQLSKQGHHRPMLAICLKRWGLKKLFQGYGSVEQSQIGLTKRVGGR